MTGSAARQPGLQVKDLILTSLIADVMSLFISAFTAKWGEQFFLIIKLLQS